MINQVINISEVDYKYWKENKNKVFGCKICKKPSFNISFGRPYCSYECAEKDYNVRSFQTKKCQKCVYYYYDRGTHSVYCTNPKGGKECYDKIFKNYLSIYSNKKMFTPNGFFRLYQTLLSKVFQCLEKKPKITIEQLFEEFPKENLGSLRNYYNRFSKEKAEQFKQKLKEVKENE